jgi:hypothetical protein
LSKLRKAWEHGIGSRMMAHNLMKKIMRWVLCTMRIVRYAEMVVCIYTVWCYIHLASYCNQNISFLNFD